MKGGGKRCEIQNSIILRKFGPENTHNQNQNTSQPARTHAAVAGRGEIQSDFQIKRSEIPGGHMPRRQIWTSEINQSNKNLAPSPNPDFRRAKRAGKKSPLFCPNPYKTWRFYQIGARSAPIFLKIGRL